MKNNTFKEYIQPTVVLVAICLVITFALAYVNSITGYLKQYQGLAELANADNIKGDSAVSFVSGATISSNGVYQGVCAALQQYQTVQGGAN